MTGTYHNCPTRIYPNIYPNTTSPTVTINYPPQLELPMTDSDIDKVADRVLEKLKADVFNLLLEADPAAVAQLLLTAVKKAD